MDGWLSIVVVVSEYDRAGRIHNLARDFEVAVSQDRDWAAWWRTSGMQDLDLFVRFLDRRARREQPHLRGDSVLAGARSCEVTTWIPLEVLADLPSERWLDAVRDELLAVLALVRHRLGLPELPPLPPYGEGWSQPRPRPDAAGATPAVSAPVVHHDEPVIPRTLTDAQFWSLIGVLEQRVDLDALERLRARLMQIRPGELAGFADQFADKVYALDTRQHFEQPVRLTGQEGRPAMPMSEDVFLYVRCAVVAQGKVRWLRTVKDPSLIADAWDLDAEHLLNLPRQVFESRTGRLWEHVPAVGVETGSNAEAW